MGEEAESLEDGQVEEAVGVLGDAVNESEDGEKTDAQEDSGGIDVVRSDEEGTQPDKQRDLNRIINRRLKREKRKTESANETASDAANALEIEKQKNRLLQLALEQKGQATENQIPDPDDFDEGVSDPGYIARFNAYHQQLIQQEVRSHEVASSQRREGDEVLEQAKRKHYEKAYALGALDYDEVEDKAIDALGEEVVNHLIRSSDNTHVILYYLGKNPDEAEDLSALIKTDPVKATLKIGRLEAELQVQKKDTSKPTPDPDEELPGGTPSASDHLKQKYEKLVAKAQVGGPQSQKYMKEMAKLRTDAKERGINLRK